MSEVTQRSQFLKTVVPVRIGLLNASTELQPTIYWSEARQERGERAVSARYSSGGVSGTCFDVLGNFEFAIRLQEETGVSFALRIVCTFLGHFHRNVDEEPETSDVETFAREDAWVMFWPYFRQFVSDTTARMSIPPETLPLAFAPGEATKGPPKALKKAKTAPRLRKK